MHMQSANIKCVQSNILIKWNNAAEMIVNLAIYSTNIAIYSGIIAIY